MSSGVTATFRDQMKQRQDQQESQPIQAQPRAQQSFYGALGGRPPNGGALNAALNRPAPVPVNVFARQQANPAFQRPVSASPVFARSQGNDPNVARQAMARRPVAAAVSDEDQKDTQGADVDTKLKDFLDKLSRNEYVYKDPSIEGAAEGKQFGPMAQDMERSEVGKTLVKEGDDGVKRVDTQRLALVNAATQAHINARLAKVEKKGGK